MRRTVLLLAFGLINCGDPTGAKPRGDPWTIVVTHAHLTGSLAQHYDLFLVIDDAGPTPPISANQGGWDSVQVVAGINYCSSLSTDSLGARTVLVELRSSAPSPVGDTLRSTDWDPAAVPSADSAVGYGQSPTKPYFWHWYIANDSNVVRGDTARYIQPSNGQPCTF